MNVVYFFLLFNKLDYQTVYSVGPYTSLVVMPLKWAAVFLVHRPLTDEHDG